MKSEIIQTLTTTFEAHAEHLETGVEFWLARDLQYLLGYTKWENFITVIGKPKTACGISGHEVEHHFPDVRKMVKIGSGTPRESDDVMLTRYAVLPKAKDFATEITIHNARQHQMGSENDVSNEHITNNEAARKTLIERGIRPESLPAEEDIKKVERRLTSEEKKSIKNPDTLE